MEYAYRTRYRYAPTCCARKWKDWAQLPMWSLRIRYENVAMIRYPLTQSVFKTRGFRCCWGVPKRKCHIMWRRRPKLTLKRMDGHKAHQIGVLEKQSKRMRMAHIKNMKREIRQLFLVSTICLDNSSRPSAIVWSLRAPKTSWFTSICIAHKWKVKGPQLQQQRLLDNARTVFNCVLEPMLICCHSHRTLSFLV